MNKNTTCVQASKTFSVTKLADDTYAYTVWSIFTPGRGVTKLCRSWTELLEKTSWLSGTYSYKPELFKQLLAEV